MNLRPTTRSKESLWTISWVKKEVTLNRIGVSMSNLSATKMHSEKQCAATRTRSEGDKKRFFLDNTDWRNRAKEKRKRCALLESRGKEAEKTMGGRKKTRRKGRFLDISCIFSQLPCPALFVNILMLSAGTLIASADTIRMSADSLIVSTDTLRKGTFPECHRNGQREKLWLSSDSRTVRFTELFTMTDSAHTQKTKKEAVKEQQPIRKRKRHHIVNISPPKLRRWLLA